MGEQVEANLDGLRQYVCDRPVGGDVGDIMVGAYLFDGDEAIGIKPRQILGLDRDGDKYLDFFVSASTETWERYRHSTNSLAPRAAFGAWGTSVKVPLKQLTELTSHCEDWDKQRKNGLQSIGAIALGGLLVVSGGGGIFLGVAAGVTAPAMAFGSLALAGGIYSYFSIHNTLGADVSQKTFTALKSAFKLE